MIRLAMHSDHPEESNEVILKKGTRIADRYRLGEVLEEHHDRVIFEAIDEQNGFDVLMRFRPEASVPDPRLREAGVPQYTDRGCIGQWFGAVLDPGVGKPLADALQALDTDAVPIRELITLGTDLLTTLNTLHALGMVHGNLGIHSLHLTPDWGVRIVDFPDSVGPLLAQAHPFASPERHRDETTTDLSDLYTVGALLYSLATGRPPFGVSGEEAREGHLHHGPPPHEALAPVLHDVLAKAMRKAPGDRYLTAAEMREALLEVWEQIRPRETAPPPDPFTFGAVPIRIAEPVWEEECFEDEVEQEDDEATWLPMVALALLVGSVAALAIVGLGLAGGVYWATSTGALVPPQVEAVADVEETPLTMPVANSVAVVSTKGPAEDATPAVQDAEALEEAVIPGVAGESVRVPVSFGYDSYQAKPEADWPEFIDSAEAHPGAIRLTGHTDNLGSTEANRLMGLGRAWSVSVLMAAHGITEGRIEVESAGESQPIAPNSDARGRAANRRVTAEFRGKEPLLQDLLVPAQSD